MNSFSLFKSAAAGNDVSFAFFMEILIYQGNTTNGEFDTLYYSRGFQITSLKSLEY
jgi:hypothetical protein